MQLIQFSLTIVLVGVVFISLTLSWWQNSKANGSPVQQVLGMKMSRLEAICIVSALLLIPVAGYAPWDVPQEANKALLVLGIYAVVGILLTGVHWFSSEQNPR